MRSMRKAVVVGMVALSVGLTACDSTNSTNDEEPSGGVALSGSSDDWIVAWASRTDDDALLLTRDRTSGESRGEHPVPEKSEVITIDAAGYIWMYDSDRNVTFAVDRTGAERTEEISGRLVAIGDGTLIAQREDRSYEMWSFEAA